VRIAFCSASTPMRSSQSTRNPSGTRHALCPFCTLQPTSASSCNGTVGTPRCTAMQALPSRESQVTLVTQCSADRLHAVLRQALRWGGDISLAVYVPSAPSFAKEKVNPMLSPEVACNLVGEILVSGLDSPLLVLWLLQANGSILGIFEAVLFGAAPENAFENEVRRGGGKGIPPVGRRYSRSRLRTHFDITNHPSSKDQAILLPPSCHSWLSAERDRRPCARSDGCATPSTEQCRQQT